LFFITLFDSRGALLLVLKISINGVGRLEYLLVFFPDIDGSFARLLSCGDESFLFLMYSHKELELAILRLPNDQPYILPSLFLKSQIGQEKHVEFNRKYPRH